MPDDDYTTLVPQTKPVNAINRNLSQTPTIVGNKENNSPTKKSTKPNNCLSRSVILYLL